MLKNMTGTDLKGGVKEQEMRSCLHPLSLSPLILALSFFVLSSTRTSIGSEEPTPLFEKSRGCEPGGVANLELDGLSVRRDLNIGIYS